MSKPLTSSSSDTLIPIIPLRIYQTIADTIANIHTLQDGKKETDINYSKISTRKPQKEENQLDIEFDPDIKLD